MTTSESDYDKILEELLQDTPEEEREESGNNNLQSLISPLHDYSAEAVNILGAHQTNSIQNALKLNKELQRILIELKSKLEGLLCKCRNKHKKNEEVISIYYKHCKKYPKKEKDQLLDSGSGRQLRSYFSCGAPFFKDKSNFPAQLNDDYIQRKSQKELFPFDLNNMQHCWTLRDKANLLQGVETQVINYLLSKSAKQYYNSNITEKKQENLKTVDFHSKNLIKLLKDVGEDFEINWYRISAEDLNGRHPENTCMTMWFMYLKPDINRNKWTKTEDEKLLKVAREYNFENWKEIASEMDNRSEYQCFVHFRADLASKLKLGSKWTEEEDHLLIKAVDKYRFGKVIRWNKVVTHFPHRTKKQVYTRYMNSINPNIDKRKFTEEEDCIIMAAIQQYGETFSRIPISLFPGRTLIQVRNRYNNVLKYNKIRKYWTIEDDRKLLQLVEKYGTSNWFLISKELQYHSRISCRTRYIVISKYLKNHPGAKVENLPRKCKRPLTEVCMDNWIDKIIELRKKGRTEEIQKVIIKKETYVEKLRPVQRKFYEFFKLSYNFQFGIERICNTRDWINLNMLTTLFGLHINNQIIDERKLNFNKNEFNTIKLFRDKVNNNKNTICILKSDFTLPPNWCSLVGLRALCIQCTPRKNSCSENKSLLITKNSKHKDLIDVAKKRFRDRFFSIFYKAATLCQLELIFEKNDNHVEEKEEGNLQENVDNCSVSKLETTERIRRKDD